MTGPNIPNPDYVIALCLAIVCANGFALLFNKWKRYGTLG